MIDLSQLPFPTKKSNLNSIWGRCDFKFFKWKNRFLRNIKFAISRFFSLSFWCLFLQCKMSKIYEDKLNFSYCMRCHRNLKYFIDNKQVHLYDYQDRIQPGNNHEFLKEELKRSAKFP